MSVSIDWKKVEEKIEWSIKYYGSNMHGEDWRRKQVAEHIAGFMQELINVHHIAKDLEYSNHMFVISPI